MGYPRSAFDLLLYTGYDHEMPGTTYDLSGVRVFECTVEGQQLHHEQDAITIIGEAMAQAAELIVIPIARLHSDFFQLRTQLAGGILQKFVNYRLRVVIVGDLLELASTHPALRSFIYESNQGDQLWFLSDMDQLRKRLTQQSGR